MPLWKILIYDEQVHVYVYIYMINGMMIMMVMTLLCRIARLYKMLPHVLGRLKGWILCDADGLCLVALREAAAYFYENRLLFSAPWPRVSQSRGKDVRDARLHEEKLQRIEAVGFRLRFVVIGAALPLLQGHGRSACQLRKGLK